MIKTTKNQTFIIIAVIYIISWLIPIGVNLNHGSTLMGYDGAEAAHDVLGEGITYFINILFSETIFTYEGFIKYLFKIVGGLPNILFIAAFILATFNNKYSFYFIAPCVLIMLLWGGGEFIFGGYTLWLLAGLWLLVISVKTYKIATNKTNVTLLASGPLLITYFIGVLAITSSMLE